MVKQQQKAAVSDGCFLFKSLSLRDQELHLGLEVLLTHPFPDGMDYTMLPEGASHYSL